MIHKASGEGCLDRLHQVVIFIVAPGRSSAFDFPVPRHCAIPHQPGCDRGDCAFNASQITIRSRIGNLGTRSSVGTSDVISPVKPIRRVSWLTG
jgi:hypothetical protein